MPKSRPKLIFIVCALMLLASCARLTERPKTPAGWRGVVSTLAGSGAPGYSDGAARETRFADPFGVAVAADGSVYVADAGEANRIRKVSPEGVVATLAGGREGFADGAGAAASFNTPSALALDAAGNLYVADTGNNRVRKVTPEGAVTTLAGGGEAGYVDGPAAQARFDAPVGVAVDRDGNVYVADTYNDRVRVITKDGVVKTLAGNGATGNADGASASFDTPCGVAVNDAGEVYVADTGNDRLRKITKDGQVITLNLFDPASNAQPSGAADGNVSNGGNANASNAPSAMPFELSNPVGLAITHDGFVYVTELDRSRVVQVAPDGAARVIAGRGPSFADGEALDEARFNQPAGLALAHDGSLVVADTANYLVRRVIPSRQGGGASASNPTQTASTRAPQDGARPSPNEVLPRISIEELGESFPWPVDPQDKWHEIVGTMGEVRGAYGTDDSRDHLHSGVDVFGLYGQTVRVVREEKVASPLPNWGFGGLNEGVRVGLMTYVHLRVGRDEQDRMLAGTPFTPVRDEAGKVSRVRVRRGTRLRVGDALGTINRMFHVHMNLGPPGAELNPLALPLPGLTDKTPPVIEREGVRLFDESGAELKQKRGGHLLLSGRVRIVVDAYDQVDGNQSRRRLGLYRLGFQLLTTDGSPAPGFESPRVSFEFNRLPPGPDAPKIAYADESGITVYGSQRTRFLYELTNNVRDGRTSRATWDTSEIPGGDYTLRVLAADFAGNEADANRDVLVTIVRD
ncbi:MAG TPA: NHL repeat-containing protein [Pyrinomonadaceae bacterium]|jgi:sugar lactone lactonase YvrE|nr:NHL repeat-containing protein [Pyrinomonadaceae bacterium]